MLEVAAQAGHGVDVTSSDTNDARRSYGTAPWYTGGFPLRWSGRARRRRRAAARHAPASCPSRACATRAVGARYQQLPAAAGAHALLAEVLRDRLEQIDATVPAVAPLPAALQIGEELAVDVLAGDQRLADIDQYVVVHERQELLRAKPFVAEHADVVAGT